MTSMNVQPIRPISFSRRSSFTPEQFAKLSDEQLYALAKKANKGFARKNNLKADAYFYGTPLVASAVVGAATSNGGLVGRTAGALKNAGSWGGFFTVLALSSFAMRGVAKKVKPVGDFENKHPFLALASRVTVIYGAWQGATALFNKSKAIVANKLPNMVQQFTSLKGKIATALTSSKFNTNIYQPAAKKTAEFLTKHSNVKAAAKYAIPTLMVGSIIYGVAKAFVKREEIAAQEQNNFFALKMMSNAIKEDLAARQV